MISLWSCTSEHYVQLIIMKIWNGTRLNIGNNLNATVQEFCPRLWPRLHNGSFSIAFTRHKTSHSIILAAKAAQEVTWSLTRWVHVCVYTQIWLKDTSSILQWSKEESLLLCCWFLYKTNVSREHKFMIVLFRTFES